MSALWAAENMPIALIRHISVTRKRGMCGLVALVEDVTSIMGDGRVPDPIWGY